MEQNTYHPHMHILVDIRLSYQSKGYIKMDEWRSPWQEFMKIEYKPQVDARMMKSGNSGGLAEITKDLTKPSVYVTYDDLRYTAQQFDVFHRELYGCRMTSAGGGLFGKGNVAFPY